MTVCNGGGATVASLLDSRTRGYWASAIPFVFLLLILPLRAIARRFWPTSLLTLEEAEALISGEDVVGKDAPPVPLWRTLVLATISFVECSAWLVVGCYTIITNPADILDGVPPFLLATTWIYAALRPLTQPLVSVPYDLLVLLGLHLVCSSLVLIGDLFDGYVFASFRAPWALAANVTNIAAIVVALATLLSMPLGIPSKHIKKEDIGKTVCPEDYTTVWGWLTFRWLDPLLDLGYTKTLNEEDVWKISPLMQARPLHIRISRFPGTLLRKLWQAHRVELLIDILLAFVSVTFSYSGPVFLKMILDALADPNPETIRERRARALVYAFLAFLGKLCQAQADLQRLWTSRRASGRVRSELMAAIYDKALKRRDLSGTIREGVAKETGPSKSGADVGKIVNLMAGDASRIANFVAYMYFIYQCPFDIVLATLFLYRLLGWSAFAGICVLSLTWPLNRLVGKSSINVQKGLSGARDKRMSVLNELISAVKFIKFFAWEDRWIKRVSEAREVELQWLVKERINSLLFSFIWMSVPILVSVSSFFVYVALGHELTIGTAFTAIAIFQNLRQPFNGIPTWFVQLFQSRVALERISAYLDEEEVDEQVSALKKGHVPPSDDAENGLGIEHGTFIWNATKGLPVSGENAEHSDISNGGPYENGANERRFELQDIDIVFPDEALTVVTGPTASGKTALLMALLGELTILKGRLIMSKNTSKIDKHGLAHTISYAAQTPWLRHESIRDNILFGSPYDELRYNAVVESCALLPDLEILEDGDMTEIGARGVNLSGGQKARVALARAVYARSKYVLLDDPLSAVDSHTARFLYENLLQGSLLENRTVILVTHHVELVLPGAKYLVHMSDGRIDLQGEVAALRARGELDDIAKDDEKDANLNGDAVSVKTTRSDQRSRVERKGKEPRRYIEDEHRATGRVKWRIYKTYLVAASYWTWAILVLFLIFSQILGVGEKLWIKVWGEAYGAARHVSIAIMDHYTLPEEQYPLGVNTMPMHHVLNAYNHSTAVGTVQATALPSAQENPYFYVGVFTAISLAAALVKITGVAVQYAGALRASRILFNKLLGTVVRATMRWHDTTPQGRMLNRFSKDIEAVDTTLAGSLQSVNTSLAAFAVSMLTIIVIFPPFIVPGAILGLFYWRTSILYLSTGRDIQRMESNTRSPIFATFSELLEGIVSVRAFGAEQRFLDDMYRQIDLTTRMWWTFWMMNRWVSLKFDVLGAAGTFATSVFALSGFVDAGLAGVCITSAMSFSSSTYWICRNWTALELELNSVERVVEYLELPQEPPAIITSNRPPAYWPSTTSANKDSMLVVENLVVRYAEGLPEVLRGVSFSLKAGERVGLLGRTGSGKSTLAMSLLRFVDPASGHIKIDGIDITTIGLHDLRSRITFIPQDAVLFSGTIRDNLDPFGEHTDSECIGVLQRLQLIQDHHSPPPSQAASASSTTLPGDGVSTTELHALAELTLDTAVSPGGTNFSQGQRQLVALARALLRRSAIIVLDEATSSIDFATDAKIQNAIRTSEFGQGLLLTVAHRLRTVIDYDRLLVLDEGKVAEFDTPLNLMLKAGGIFRTMCQKSGIYSELEAIARANAERSSKDKDL